jgi:hypothetical protein
LKNGPTTDDKTRVINSGETVRLKINLSDADGLSDINQIEINTNFKKLAEIPQFLMLQLTGLHSMIWQFMIKMVFSLM